MPTGAPDPVGCPSICARVMSGLDSPIDADLGSGSEVRLDWAGRGASQASPARRERAFARVLRVLSRPLLSPQHGGHDRPSVARNAGASFAVGWSLRSDRAASGPLQVTFLDSSVGRLGVGRAVRGVGAAVPCHEQQQVSGWQKREPESDTG